MVSIKALRQSGLSPSFCRNLQLLTRENQQQSAVFYKLIMFIHLKVCLFFFNISFFNCYDLFKLISLKISFNSVNLRAPLARKIKSRKLKESFISLSETASFNFATYM